MAVPEQYTDSRYYKTYEKDGKTYYQEKYSGKVVHVEATPAPVAPAPLNDAQALRQQAYDGAYFELDEMPEEARVRVANQIADHAAMVWQTGIEDQGLPPGLVKGSALEAVDKLIRETAATNKITPASQREQNQAAAGGGIVNQGDVGAATQVYRDAVESGKGVYGRILAKTGEPDPSAIAFFNNNQVKPGTVGATTIGDPRQLKGVRQEGTTVEGTDLSALQATAQGQGAGQQQAAARYRQALQSQAQTTNAQIQAQRGAERKGLRRAALLAGGEQAVQVGAKIAEADATTSLAAQQNVAEFQARKNEKQAELDNARRSGDANRIQQAEKDMAALEQEGQKFNAQQIQTADTTNVSNDQAAQGTNQAAGMDAIKQDFETWKQTNQLALDAQKALEASAQGLLNEDQRQQALANARRQLDLAEREYEEAVRRNARQEELQARQQKRTFWGTMITSLLAIGATTLGGPAAGAATQAVGTAVTQAAHGGAVTAPRFLMAGEAGDHELVIPIKGKLSDRMLRALSVDAQPFNAAGPKGEIDNMEDLTRAIKATLQTAPNTSDDMTSMLAAATLRSRRAR